MLLFICFVAVNAVPPGWEQYESNAEASPFHFRLSLKQTGISELERIAQKVSHPSDEIYGSHLSTADIDEIVRFDSRAVSLVEAWVHSSSCLTRQAKEIISIICPTVKAAGELLHTRFYSLRNPLTGQEVLHAGRVDLPSQIAKVVQCIYDVHGFPLPPRSALPSYETTAAAIVTPAVIDATYQIQGVVPTGSEHNRQAVAEFQVSVSQSDNSLFSRFFCF
jgi:hypothetical protein